MMDLSMGKDEKEFYVVNVKLKEDCKSFVVFFADGHTEEHPFLVHNYNVYIYRMKRQLLDKRESFEDTLKFVASMEVVKEFKTLLYSLAGIILTTNIDMHVALKTIIICLIGIYNAKKAIERLVELLLIKYKLLECAKTAEFVKIMEDFRIDATDPITGREEDWYLFNIGDIDINSNIGALKLFSMGFSDEFKKEESKRISELFKEKHEMSLIKKPKEAK